MPRFASIAERVKAPAANAKGVLTIILVFIVGLMNQYGEYGTVWPLISSAALCVWFLMAPRNIHIAWNEKGLGWAFVALIGVHFAYMIARVGQGHVAASGGATVAAIDAVMHGLNPYTQPIDSVSISGTDYLGYKYLPMMLVFYGPLTAAFGYIGILLTNFIADTLIACQVVLLARRLGAPGAAAFSGGLLYLTMFFIPGSLYAKGENDAIPVALLLGSWLFESSSPFWAGVLAGASLSAKLSPAAAVAPALLPRECRLRYGLGVLAGLVPAVLAAVAAPTAFLNNAILFSIYRSPIGFTAQIPHYLAQPAKFGLIAAWVAMGAYLVLSRLTLRKRLIFAIIMLNVTILAGPIMRKNYNIWWAALICAVAVAPFRREPELAAREA